MFPYVSVLKYFHMLTFENVPMSKSSCIRTYGNVPIYRYTGIFPCVLEKVPYAIIRDTF